MVLLHLNHVLVAQPVQLAGADTGLDERRDVIEDFCGESSCDPHFVDIARWF